MNIQADSKQQTQAVIFASIRVVGLGIGLLTSVLIVRQLAVNDYGYFAAASAVVTLVSAFGLFGLDQIYLSGHMREPELRRSVLRIAFILAATGLLAGVIWPGLDRQERELVFVLSLGAGLECLRSVWLLAPQRDGLYSSRARRELLSRFVIAAGSSLGAVLFGSALGVALGGLFANFLITLAATIVIHRTRPLRRDWADHPHLWERLRQGMPYAISGGLYTVYFSVDLALLGSLSPPEEAAHYRVACAFITVAVAIPIAMNNEVFRPRMYHLLSVREPRVEEARRISRQFLRLSLALGTAVSLTMMTLGRAMVTPIFGSRYEAAEGLLLILSSGLLFHYFSSWSGNLLVSMGRIRPVVLLQGVLALANVGANAFLIPMYGGMGAAIATVGTEILGCMSYLFIIVRHGIELSVLKK